MNYKTRKWLVLAIIMMCAVGAVAYGIVNRSSTKTSVVTGRYSESAQDGCDGFILQNGDKVSTFCFWTKPGDQTRYDESIKVGDRVEYNIKSPNRFIRLIK